MGMEPGKELSLGSLPWSTRLRLRLTSDIDTRWADTILLACFFTTGMVDSIAFNTWSCFVGMQTGNTIFAGLGVSDLPANVPQHTWTKSLIAILSLSRRVLFLSVSSISRPTQAMGDNVIFFHPNVFDDRDRVTDLWRLGCQNGGNNDS